MRLAVVNPNSTVSMTEKIAAAAGAAAPGATIDARTCSGSPAAIEGPADGALAEPHVIAEIRAAAIAGADAAIIACFDDTALAEAQATVAIPVLGIGQAGYAAAVLLGRRFSVVTTLAVSVPILEGNICDYGFQPFCARVRASDVPVLELERPGAGARQRISDEIARAKVEDVAQAIVLGCAGMADLAADLEAEHGLPVIDGVAAAAGFALGLAALRPKAQKEQPCPAQ